VMNVANFVAGFLIIQHGSAILLAVSAAIPFLF